MHFLADFLCCGRYGESYLCIGDECINVERTANVVVGLRFVSGYKEKVLYFII